MYLTKSFEFRKRVSLSDMRTVGKLFQALTVLGKKENFKVFGCSS